MMRAFWNERVDFPLAGVLEAREVQRFSCDKCMLVVGEREGAATYGFGDFSE